MKNRIAFGPKTEKEQAKADSSTFSKQKQIIIKRLIDVVKELGGSARINLVTPAGSYSSYKVGQLSDERMEDIMHDINHNIGHVFDG